MSKTKMIIHADPEHKEMFEMAAKTVQAFALVIEQTGMNECEATLGMMMLSAFNSKRSRFVDRDEFIRSCAAFYDGTIEEKVH